MQIPKNIKVGGIRYRVQVVGSEELEDKVGGKIATDKCLIKIIKAEPQYMHQTFLHEVLHAINMEIEEEKIEFLSQALYQVICDNPKVFEVGDKHE